MNLVHVKGNTWYLEGVQMIPLYKVDDCHCILLDSGWVWEREALKGALERENLTPVGVLGSHTHEDHAGNHGWLKKTYGAKICMSSGEAMAIASPVGLKVHFCGMSLKEAYSITGDIFVQTDRVIGADEEEIDFMGVTFRIHHTAGHSVDHICIGTPDGVCYVGDLLLSDHVLAGAKLPFHFVHALARESMMGMRDVQGYTHFLAAHKGVFEDMPTAVDRNLAHLDWICDNLLGLMEDWTTWDRLMNDVIERNQLYTGNEIKAVDYEQAVRLFIEYLIDAGKASVRAERGIRQFRANR